jgi:hypothetical protein
VIIPSRRRWLSVSAALVAAMCGVAGAVLFARAGLTRGFDDPAVVLSIGSFAIAAGSIAWIASRVTESLWAAAAAVFVVVINPNLLYLQSTPESELLPLGLMLAAVAMMIEWSLASLTAGPTLDVRARPFAHLIGFVSALACVMGYEAWPVAIAAVGGAIWTRRRHGEPLRRAVEMVATIAVYPLATIVALIIYSIVRGEWSESHGVLVAGNPPLGDPLAAANRVLTGVRTVGGTVTTVIAMVGLIGLAARGLLTDAGFTIVALAPVAAAVVPWLAYLQGYPQRTVDVVPLLAAQAVGVGAAAGRWGRAAPVAAAIVMGIAAYEMLPMFGAIPVAVAAEGCGGAGGPGRAGKTGEAGKACPAPACPPALIKI